MLDISRALEVRVWRCRANCLKFCHLNELGIIMMTILLLGG